MGRLKRGDTVLPEKFAGETHDKYSERSAADPAYQAAAADLRARHSAIRALVKIRETSRESQRAVARSMGVSQATVSEFERHSDDPHLSTLQRYARAVGARVEIRVEAIHGWNASSTSYPTQRAAHFASASLVLGGVRGADDTWPASVAGRESAIAEPRYKDFGEAA